MLSHLQNFLFLLFFQCGKENNNIRRLPISSKNVIYCATQDFPFAICRISIRWNEQKGHICNFLYIIYHVWNTSYFRGQVEIFSNFRGYFKKIFFVIMFEKERTFIKREKERTFKIIKIKFNNLHETSKNRRPFIRLHLIHSNFLAVSFRILLEGLELNTIL